MTEPETTPSQANVGGDAAEPGSPQLATPVKVPADAASAGERRPPDPSSQRYVAAARPDAVDDSADQPSIARGALVGGVVALFLAAIIVLFGGVFAFTAGLVVISVFLGRLVAVAVNAGARDAGSSTTRLALAVGLALGGVAVAQVGLWLWAGVEGGTLGLVDYLGETYGPLVPLQFLLAGGTAAISVK